MELMDFLSLDSNNPENVPGISSYVFKNLEELARSDFSGENVHNLDGVINKFIYTMGAFVNFDKESIKNDAKKLIEKIIETDAAINPARRRNCIAAFEKLNNKLINLYTEVISQINESTIFDGFDLLYRPDSSDKSKAISLISEAIRLVESETSFTHRQKNQIIRALKKALSELEKERSNWTSYFGTVHQIIVLLGAIGSLAGGVGSWVAIRQANEKLIEATHIIESTSINQYHLNIIEFENKIYQYKLETNTSKEDLPSNSRGLLSLPPGKDE